MGDKNMKALAKKRASKDISADEPKVNDMGHPDNVGRHEESKESKRAIEYAYKSATPLERGEAKVFRDDDLGDHKTKLKRKQKFTMMKSLLGSFDEMDQNGNGIPDLEE